MKTKEFMFEAKKPKIRMPKQRDPNWKIMQAKATSGAGGAHKDLKKAEKQGDVKHRKDLVPMESMVNEDLSNFTDAGIPAEFAKNILRKFQINHDAEISPVPGKPKTSDIENGDMIINVLPGDNVVAVLKRREYPRFSASYTLYHRLTLIDGKFQSDTDTSVSAATKGMAARGKFFRISNEHLRYADSPRRGDKPTPDEVRDRSTDDPLAGSSYDIYSYMNDTFMPRMRAQMETMVDDIYANLRKLDKNKDQWGGERSRLSKNQQEVALEAASIIEQIAKDGFTRNTMERFLSTFDKRHHGFASIPNNERELKNLLKTEPNARAKWAKVVLDAAKEEHRRVKEMIAAPVMKALKGEGTESVSESPSDIRDKLSQMRSGTQDRLSAIRSGSRDTLDKLRSRTPATAPSKPAAGPRSPQVGDTIEFGKIMGSDKKKGTVTNVKGPIVTVKTDKGEEEIHLQNKSLSYSIIPENTNESDDVYREKTPFGYVTHRGARAAAVRNIDKYGDPYGPGKADIKGRDSRTAALHKKQDKEWDKERGQKGPYVVPSMRYSDIDSAGDIDDDDSFAKVVDWYKNATPEQRRDLENHPAFQDHPEQLEKLKSAAKIDEGWGDVSFKVGDWTYEAEEIAEEDVVKIWHDAISPDGKRHHIDFTPYETMDKKTFKLWIKLGMPKRQGRGPLNTEEIIKMAQIKGVADLDRDMARAGMKEGSDFGEPKEILEDVLDTLEREVEWPLTEVMDYEEVLRLLAPIKNAVNQRLKTMDKDVSEAGYNPLDYERDQIRQMDYEKRAFKRAELQHELGHEDDPDFERKMMQKQMDKDKGPWYIRINGKIYKQKGEAKVFDWKRAANNYALAILKNKPELQGKILLTKNSEDQ
jgi:hypothetical protein